MIHDDDALLGGEREQKRSCVPDQSPHDPTSLRQGRFQRDKDENVGLVTEYCEYSWTIHATRVDDDV